jgi:hypothetical protein
LSREKKEQKREGKKERKRIAFHPLPYGRGLLGGFVKTCLILG